MKWILIIVGSLLALALGVTLIGMLMPRTHRASSRIALRQPADTVWVVVRGVDRVASFWPTMKKSARLADRDGHEVWQQTMSDGSAMMIEVVESDPPRQFKTVIVAPEGAPFGGSWTYQIEPAAGGSQVTVTEDGWVAVPPFRVFARMMGYHTTLDSYLKALGRKFGEDVTPIHRD